MVIVGIFILFSIACSEDVTIASDIFVPRWSHEPVDDRGSPLRTEGEVLSLHRRLDPTIIDRIPLIRIVKVKEPPRAVCCEDFQPHHDLPKVDPLCQSRSVSGGVDGEPRFH